MKKYHFLLIGLVIFGVIIFVYYYLTRKNAGMKDWVSYDECNNIGGEIVLPDTSFIPYRLILA